MMEYWNFECVECHKTCRVICKNCHHVNFKGGKKTTNSVTKYYLECQNCKIQMVEFSHNCGEVREVLGIKPHLAITSLDRNKDNFFKSRKKPPPPEPYPEPKPEVRNNKSVIFLTLLCIFIFFIYLLFI